jgi:hypothetical protein
MKRTVFIISMIAAVILAGGTAALFAEGLQEGAPAPAYAAGERVTVEGEVSLSASRPELTADDGQVYELMYPYFLAEGVELSSGDRITVEGLLVPGPRWAEDDDELHLRVERAVIDGRQYEIGAFDARRGYGPCVPGPRGYGRLQRGRNWRR